MCEEEYGYGLVIVAFMPVLLRRRWNALTSLPSRNIAAALRNRVSDYCQINPALASLWRLYH